jgi:hypothetical protein
MKLTWIYSVFWVLQGQYFLCKLENKRWCSTSTIADTSNPNLATLLPKNLLERNYDYEERDWYPKMMTKVDTYHFSFLFLKKDNWSTEGSETRGDKYECEICFCGHMNVKFGYASLSKILIADIVLFK